MRKAFSFGLVFFLLAPFSLFAEAAAPYARYCPDPTDIFTGVAHETENTPKITVKVNPEFKAKMKVERSMGDLPLTPVYDLVVTVVPTINEYCLPQYDTSGAKIREVDPPQLFSFSTSLVVGNTATADSTLVIGILKRTETKSDTGEWQYEWKAKGWPNGIADSAKMERLIEAISKNQSVNVIVEVKRPGKETVFEKSPVSFSLCAPVWGNGQHKIVGMYDEGKDASQVVDYFDEVRKIGFTKIEPYASNQSFFSYFVDLKKVLGGSITPLAQIALDAKNAKLRAPTISSQRNTLAKYINASSCKDGIYLLKVKTQNNSLPWGIGGIAILGGSVRGALIDTEGARFVAGSRGASDVGIVYVHELSHTFAKLNDEYVYRAQSVNVGLPLRNCSVRPAADFSLNGNLYGSTKYQGCSFQYDAGEKPGVPNARYYRPSNKSVMNADGDEFNVVSCGYILAAIKGGDAKSYFPECAGMNGIVKDGVGQSASAWDSFSSIFSLFDGVSNSLVAEAVDAFKAGAQVKVIVPESRTPPAEFVVLEKGEKTTGPELCLDATAKGLFDKKQQPFRADLEKGWKNQAQCVQNIADATVLEQQIADLQSSIKISKTLLDAVTESEKELSSRLASKELGTSDGVQLVLVPAGEVYKKQYEGAENIKMQCVNSEAAPVGKTRIVSGDSFIFFGETYAQHLLKVLESRTKVSAKMMSGNIVSAIGDLLDLRSELKKSMAFLPLIPEVFKKYSPVLSVEVPVDLESVVVSFGVEITSKIVIQKKSGEKKEEETIFAPVDPFQDFLPDAPAVLRNPLIVSAKAVLFFAGVGAPYLAGTLTINGEPFYAPLPEKFLKENLREIFTDQKARLLKLQNSYTARLKPLVAKYEKLKASEYACSMHAEPTGISSLVVGTPVRKSGTTPADRRAASAEQGEQKDAPTQSSEPSYLIIESFDPNDPWGEIIEIGEGSEVATTTLATSTATTTERIATTTTTSRLSTLWQRVLGFFRNRTATTTPVTAATSTVSRIATSTPSVIATSSPAFVPTFLMTEPYQGKAASSTQQIAIPCGAPIAAAPAPVKAPAPSGFGYSGEGVSSFSYDATNYQTADNSSLITLQADGASISWAGWSGAYICHLNGVFVPVVGSTKLAPQTTSCSYTLACSDEKEKTRATKSVTVNASASATDDSSTPVRKSVIPSSILSSTAVPSISFKNSPLAPDKNISMGVPVVVGGFTATPNTGLILTTNLRFRVTIGGGGGSLSDLSDIGLFNSVGALVAKGVTDYKDGDGILFKDAFIITERADYTIRATLGTKFKVGQTLQLWANFYKDDVLFTGTKTGKNVPASKNTLNLSQMKVAALPPVVSTNVLLLEEQNLHDILSPVGGSTYYWFADGNKFLQQFYQTHGDDYDFLALFPTKQLQYSDSRVINRGIDGIGAYKIADPKIKRLQTLIVLDHYPKWEILPDFDDRFLRKNLIHEIAHHWLAFIKGLPVNPDGMHWSNNLDLFSGDSRYVDPLAYYQWIIKDNQEICVDGNADSSIIKFSDLSLYLMGLIPPEQVSPIFAHEFEKKSSNNQFQNLWGPQCEEAHKFTETKTITIQDIINANDVRNPSYKESQKNFRIAFVIVSGKGSVVPPGFIDYIKKYADALPKAWDEMTGEKSKMSVATFP